ncbi:MAG: hypothetical protein IPP91_15580 [Betaproteobacteria bacterium]|nr:hypothetical protein [Betaproteobacteria bacterium]
MSTGEPKLPAEGESLDIVRTVDDSLLTPRYGKPDIVVLASPAVMFLMELASLQLVERELPDELTSVGTRMVFEHLQPSYAGAEIVTRATVRQVSGRRIELEVESFEGQTLVARAAHTRAIVPRAKFRPPSGSTEDRGSQGAEATR